MKKITYTKKLILALVAATSLMSCSHQKVIVNRVHDEELSCHEIKEESKRLEKLLNNIDEKTGLSGRNVGMALLFWPGVFVNEMNASDAEKLANQRLAVLSNLYSKKRCDSRTKSAKKK